MALKIPGVIRFTETSQEPVLFELNRRKYLFDKSCEFRALRLRAVTLLDKVADALPTGEKLLVFDTYRSPKKQIEIWSNVLVHLAGQHPDWSEKQLKAEACRWAGNPDSLSCAHCMGAAVDLTICDKNGKPLDMGPENPLLPERSESVLTPEQQQNRNRLVTLMCAVGFVGHANKWCHFSFGDEAWARAKHKKETLYKPITHLIIKSHCQEGD